MRRTIAAGLTFWMLLAGAAFAGPLEDGRAAYARGDFAEAALHYRLAAGEGAAEAQYYLGLMYQAGRGVVQDYAEAHAWYGLAVAQGYAPAQNSLGLLYELGRGVPVD